MWSAPGPSPITRRSSNDPLGAWVVRWPLKTRLPSRLSRTFHVLPFWFWSTSNSTSILPVLGAELELPVGSARARAGADDVAVLGERRAGQRGDGQRRTQHRCGKDRACARMLHERPPCIAAASLHGSTLRMVPPHDSAGNGHGSGNRSDLGPMLRGTCASSPWRHTRLRCARCPLEPTRRPSQPRHGRPARGLAPVGSGVAGAASSRDRPSRAGSSSRISSSCSSPGSRSACGSAISWSGGSSRGRRPPPACTSNRSSSRRSRRSRKGPI